MIHHPGEVMAVFRPDDKDVKSSDNDTLATVKMWDENIFTLVVASSIASEIKQGDKVLIDYRPYNVSTADKPAIVQKQLVAKIIKGERAESVWKEYKRWYSVQKQKATQQAMQQASDYMG